MLFHDEEGFSMKEDDDSVK